MLAQVRIGVCACLLRQKVRYDGEQRRSESVADLSATRVDCTPVAGAEAARAVEAYATGDTPLHEAMTVLRRLARDLAQQEFLDSTYVFPTPESWPWGKVTAWPEETTEVAAAVRATRANGSH